MYCFVENNKYSQTMLKPPPDAKVTETEIAYFWEEDGAVCTVAKKVRRTMENLAEYTSALKERIKKRKIYYLADLTNVQSYSREEKQFLSAQLKDFTKAIAVVSSSPMGKMMSQVLFTNQDNFPFRHFNSVKEARGWIRELQDEEKR
jgi:hypothetical protein